MKPTTIDEYICAAPDEIQPRLQEIREAIRERIPDRVEAIKWGSPAFCHPDGMILVMFSSHRKHANVVVTPGAKEAVADELVDLETGKGSIKIPHSIPVPTDAIHALVNERVREYSEEGATWM